MWASPRANPPPKAMPIRGLARNDLGEPNEAGREYAKSRKLLRAESSASSSLVLSLNAIPCPKPRIELDVRGDAKLPLMLPHK